ncbi:MAG: hypothetical protein HY676_00560 [Chloroflexi bacterium]|nr:hypothetical protein [Chloroflexota bacterium]
MDVAYWRDISIIGAAGVLSTALVVFVVESVVLFRKISRAVDTQQRSQEKVAGIISFVEENIKGIAGIAGLIVGIKKAFEAFSKVSEERRE